MSERPDPTDLELMLYADGELSPERRADVEAFRRRDPSANAKLAGLTDVAELVREADRESATRVSRPSRPSRLSIADAVMARVAAEGEPRPQASPGPARVVERRTAKRVGAAVAIFAAAAGVLLALRAPPLSDDDRSASVVARLPPKAPSASPAVSVALAPKDAVGELAGGASSEHGVEVWSVDFGARSGAVLYVPSDTSPTETTTVVWLAQEDVEGE